MKYCSKCGTACEDSFAFCPACSTPFAAPAQQPAAPVQQPTAPAQQPAAPAQQPAAPVQQPAVSAPQKSSKKLVFLISGIVAILLIAAVCVWFFVLRGNGNIHKSPEAVVKAYLTTDDYDTYVDCILEETKEDMIECNDEDIYKDLFDKGLREWSGSFFPAEDLTLEILSTKELRESEIEDLGSDLDIFNIDVDDIEAMSAVKVKVKLKKESFKETYYCINEDGKWYVLLHWFNYDDNDPTYSSLQETDLANARALKSLVVANYMAADDDDSPSVYSILSGLDGDETATFYLGTDGQSIVYSSNDDCCKVSSELWGGLEKGEPISVTANKDCLIVDSIPYLPKPTE